MAQSQYGGRSDFADKASELKIEPYGPEVLEVFGAT